MRTTTVCLALASALFIAGQAHSADKIQGPISATYVSCYDGDTCRFDVQVWPGVTIHTAVRLREIDTPEIRGKCDAEKASATAARDFMVKALTRGTSVQLFNISPDKYGERVVADVVIDGVNATDLLLGADLGIPYDGGIRTGWCTPYRFDAKPIH